ncbi:hypothetical protein FGD71_012140 [Streptomyces sporangiiformans]|uniref:Uncharacterized protein n=1 Tax=Streptomyces sporangiiformans TaxID=2315329 RepID=A0A505DMT2_9ACTN|nr:hypothetical protein FGD71_012140 [Streptomyces sporangiiformans]
MPREVAPLLTAGALNLTVLVVGTALLALIDVPFATCVPVTCRPSAGRRGQRVAQRMNLGMAWVNTWVLPRRCDHGFGDVMHLGAEDSPGTRALGEVACLPPSRECPHTPTAAIRSTQWGGLIVGALGGRWRWCDDAAQLDIPCARYGASSQLVRRQPLTVGRPRPQPRLGVQEFLAVGVEFGNALVAPIPVSAVVGHGV